MKTSKTRKRPRYTDTFIREVRANYQQTASMLFTIKGPNDVADFVRSVLTDNSREHCVALYLGKRPANSILFVCTAFAFEFSAFSDGPAVLGV